MLLWRLVDDRCVKRMYMIYELLTLPSFLHLRTLVVWYIRYIRYPTPACLQTPYAATLLPLSLRISFLTSSTLVALTSPSSPLTPASHTSLNPQLTSLWLSNGANVRRGGILPAAIALSTRSKYLPSFSADNSRSWFSAFQFS